MESTSMIVCFQNDDNNNSNNNNNNNDDSKDKHLKEFGDGQQQQQKQHQQHINSTETTVVDFTSFLPDEILEFILSYLPPYKDLESCRLISKRWHSITKNLIRRTKLNLHKGLSEFRLQWEQFSVTETMKTSAGSTTTVNNNNKLHASKDTIINNNQHPYNNGSMSRLQQTRRHPQQRSNEMKYRNNGIFSNNNYPNLQNNIIPGLTIAGRFSHSAICYGNSMYVFGGGSTTDTTFNDLWRFDLSQMNWERLLSVGSYPSPKGSASMVYWNGNLVLFGGWRYPSLHPPYQPWCLFNELHYYELSCNRWTMILNESSYTWNNCLMPPPLAGHSATVHGDTMVVFGGYQMVHGLNSNSNETWCFNLLTKVWWKPNLLGNVRPQPRYGQFQMVLDEHRLLIIGGCGGPNSIYSDAWLLDMSPSDTQVWKWRSITIRNKKFAASHMWCNPGCKIGDKFVVLGPTPNTPQDFQLLKQMRMPSSSAINQFIHDNHNHNADRHHQPLRLQHPNYIDAVNGEPQRRRTHHIRLGRVGSGRPRSPEIPRPPHGDILNNNQNNNQFNENNDQDVNGVPDEEGSLARRHRIPSNNNNNNHHNHQANLNHIENLNCNYFDNQSNQSNHQSNNNSNGSSDNRSNSLRSVRVPSLGCDNEQSLELPSSMPSSERRRSFTTNEGDEGSTSSSAAAAAATTTTASSSLSPSSSSSTVTASHSPSSSSSSSSILKRNNQLEKEAADRLQRNLALRNRENEPLLPKRFDELFEDPFRMAAFNVQQRPRSLLLDHQERIRRMEEKMLYLRSIRRTTASSHPLHVDINIKINKRVKDEQSLKRHNNKRNVLSLFVCDLSHLLKALNIGNSILDDGRGAGGGGGGGVETPAAVQADDIDGDQRKKKKLQQNQLNSTQSGNKSDTKYNGTDDVGHDNVTDHDDDLDKDPISKTYLEWLENKNFGILPGSPERLILSTMVAGHGELILFGGVYKETLSEVMHHVSNNLHFLRAPKNIV